MPICIVAATSLELNLFKPGEAEVLITGIGATTTTYHLMNRLRQSRPALFIQAGIAGAFNANIQPGSTVIVTSDRFADLGVHEAGQWKDVFELGLAEPDVYPFSNGWLENPHHDLLNTIPFPQVKSISINEITTAPDRIQQLKNKYEPAVESMEGAAFHYVCLQEKIPFIQLRTVSNYVGERNKDKWHLTLSVQNLAKHLQAIVDRLA